MTLTDAFKELVNSETFKTLAKQKDSEGATLRKTLSRYRNGTLGVAAMTEILLRFGYTIDVKRPNQWKKK